MKDIKIKELTLSNWRGQNAHYTFGDNTNRISGRNSSGKSSIMKSWFWLICGSASSNEPQNHKLFDDKLELTPDTPTASVKAVITIDGEEHVLERSAKAAYSRKRGSDEYVKQSSDIYKYFVNEIEYNATEYREWLSAFIAPDDMLRFVLSGDFFVSLVEDDKRKAREIIEKVVGTVERSEMQGDYSDIDELLEKYTPDQIEERAKNTSKSIDARLNEIPTVISQKQGEISEIEQTDFNALQAAINVLECEQKSIDEKIFDYAARMKPLLEEKAKAERDKQMKQNVYDKAKETYTQGLIDTEHKLIEEISRIEKENAEKRSRTAELHKMHEIDNEVKEQYEQKVGELRKKAEEIRTMEYDSDDVCPICGQPLPDSKKAEAILQFEESRKLKFDTVIAKGKEIAGYINNLINTNKKRNEEINSIIFEDAEPLKQKLKSLRTNDNIVPFELTEQGKSLQADIDAVVVPVVKMPEDADMKQKVADIKEKLKSLYMKKGLQSRISSLKNDIEELRSEQREKGAELAKYERQRQLVKEYKQEQMEILSHKVNDGLKSSYIECWSQQKDGTSVPDIVLKNKDGVNFATANGASRIVTTCDIQRFFCEKLGVSMPVFIDESSIIQTSNLPHFDGVQTFYLFCSDEPLKIESK